MTSYSNYGRAQTFQKFALPGARASHNEHALRPRMIKRLREQHSLATRVVERTIHKIALADARSYKVAAHLHVFLQRIDTGVEEMRTSQPQQSIGLLTRTRRQIASHEQVLQVSHLIHPSICLANIHQATRPSHMRRPLHDPGQPRTKLLLLRAPLEHQRTEFLFVRPLRFSLSARLDADVKDVHTHRPRTSITISRHTVVSRP